MQTVAHVAKLRVLFSVFLWELVFNLVIVNFRVNWELKNIFNYMKTCRTSPEVAFERLRKRGRAEEAGVPMEYLQVVPVYFNSLNIFLEPTSFRSKNLL